MLKKELTLLNVYAIATGTTLSAGFFLLPGIAFNEAGPAVVLSYMIAAIPLIPAMSVWSSYPLPCQEQEEHIISSTEAWGRLSVQSEGWERGWHWFSKQHLP